jgi:prepilin-type N-terminal cleavage/methylation domain-containing protein
MLTAARRSAGAAGEPGESGQAGFTVTELVVAMSIFAVLLAIFGAAIVSFTSATTRTLQTSDQATEARNAFNLFDRQVRSAAAVNRPQLVGANWYVEYRNEAAIPSVCTQWVLRTGTSTLAVRTWVSGVSAVATPSAWRTISTAVVNTPAQPPFSFTAATVTSPRQQLTIDLRFRRGTSPATVETSTFTAANTSTSTVSNPDVDTDGRSDTQVCQDIPVVRP